MIEKQKAILYKSDGSTKEIDDMSSYYFHLKQVAEKTIRELELLYGMSEDDIQKTISQMNGMLSTRKGVDN